MPHSQRVTLEEIQQVYRAVHDCRELWADPTAWQTHALNRATAISGCRVGLCYEIADDHGFNADRVLSAEDVGWESSAERRNFVLGVAHQPLRFSPLYVEFADALPDRHNGNSLTLVQERLIDRESWRRSEMYDRYVRPTRMGEGIMSAVWMERSKTWSVWCLVNDVSEKRLTQRQQRLTEIFHREIAGLIGTNLSTWRHRSLSNLTTLRRQVLTELLRGQTEDQIAQTMFRSHAAIHEHVTSLYRHFDVTSRSQLAAYFLAREPRGQAKPDRDLFERWLRKA
jgi:DNA-binding CsgD family transcriptional regulator